MADSIVRRPKEKFITTRRRKLERIRQKPFRPICIARRQDRSVRIVIAPEMRRAVVCVVRFENERLSDLAFESDIELIAFRYLQPGFDRTKRVSFGRKVRDKT